MRLDHNTKDLKKLIEKTFNELGDLVGLDDQIL